MHSNRPRRSSAAPSARAAVDNLQSLLLAVALCAVLPATTPAAPWQVDTGG